ncbi:hypothetical protein H2199_003078 [Coniosporium tulheliwenetii]|uniref:Uncharacterized protein n=1 Tax=Coniosporium tulheliwenetii TaxID=3383036 RepID=A0ACC2ZC02_9PEZI|nr:hypothetical protein H2199_003078 [Cladosporium sp. JES 115]
MDSDLQDDGTADISSSAAPLSTSSIMEQAPNPTSTIPTKTPKAQLSKGMSHLHGFVTIAETPAATNSTVQSTETASAVLSPSAPPHPAPTTQATTSSAATFQFGSRYLEEGDDIFEFNAWDHVEVDSAYASFSEEQFEKQRQSPVSDWDKKRFNEKPEKWWDLFYAQNTANFFKNRKWLQQEFPVLAEVTKEGGKPTVLLEVGAGAGNTAFPILKLNRNERLKIHACDFSKKAVGLIRENEAYDERYIRADVWDVAATGLESLPPGLEEESVDIVMMIFIFSALAPEQWDQAVRNVWRVLKPGGTVLFRDYGRGDLAQVRFKKGRYMGENFYVRGDGTRVYFFEREELERIWGGKRSGSLDEKALGDNGDGANSTDNTTEITDKVKDLKLNSTDSIQQTEEAIADERSREPDGDSEQPAFETVDFGVDRRMLVNRQRKLKMYRCWMQAIFRKPLQDDRNNEAAGTNGVNYANGEAP